MDLATMRANGVRSVAADFQALGCHHHGVVNVDHLPDELPVPDIALHLRCSACRSKNVQTVPAWHLR